jgi:hypothetical protein
MNDQHVGDLAVNCTQDIPPINTTKTQNFYRSACLTPFDMRITPCQHGQVIDGGVQYLGQYFQEEPRAELNLMMEENGKELRKSPVGIGLLSVKMDDG